MLLADDAAFTELAVCASVDTQAHQPAYTLMHMHLHAQPCRCSPRHNTAAQFPSPSSPTEIPHADLSACPGCDNLPEKPGVFSCYSHMEKSLQPPCLQVLLRCLDPAMKAAQVVQPGGESLGKGAWDHSTLFPAPSLASH